MQALEITRVPSGTDRATGAAMRTFKSIAFAGAAFLGSLGCGGDARTDDASDTEGELTKGEDVDGKYDASAEAVFLDFAFSGKLLSDSAFNPQSQIQDQLLYTIGHLNGDRALGRLDKAVLTNVRTERTPSGKTQITYDARLPVAWGSKTNLPTSYTLKLPHDGTYAGYQAFSEKYAHACVDLGAHDVTSGSMWYYYRPNRSGCDLAAADIVSVQAAVTRSPISTTGKFPEYDRVWSDNVLRVVAVFGKFEDGATTSSDAGISGYNEFVGQVRTLLADKHPVTVPATIPAEPGVSAPDVQFTAQLGGGRSIEIVALMVDNVRNGGAAFDARYAALSTRADLIVYNGHAGLGANVRALARKGHWAAGQYAIVFMNGCDTFAYVDNALWEAHAAVNADDPAGTKYMDIVTNAMPSYFSSMPTATMALVRGLLGYDAPKTYEQIFAGIDRSEVVLVTGEQDNRFVPGGGGTPVESWRGLAASGTIAKGAEQRWQTPTLPAGRYTFAMTGTGDADLYVRIGSAPPVQQKLTEQQRRIAGVKRVAPPVECRERRAKASLGRRMSSTRHRASCLVEHADGASVGQRRRTGAQRESLSIAGPAERGMPFGGVRYGPHARAVRARHRRADDGP